MPDKKTLQVEGYGEVEATPDVAEIKLGVMSRESDARAAMQVASDKMRSGITAVQGQGVPDRDIQTSYLNLYLDQEINMYMASHNVTVRTEDVGQVGAILDAAVEAGANASSGIHFALAGRTETENRALEMAVAHARRKAETLAAALGVTIDAVERVSSPGWGAMHDVPSFGRQLAVPTAATTPIEAGQLRISAGIQVTYTFH